MQKRKLICLFCLGLFYLGGLRCLPASASVQAAGGNTIAVTGHGADEPAAIQDGLRQAVESVAGIFLVSRSQVTNLVLTRDEVTTEAAGLVTAYEIQRCTRQTSYMECRLRVTLEGDRTRIATILRELFGTSTIAVQVDEYLGEQRLREGLMNQELTAALIQKGFYVVTDEFGPSYRIQGHVRMREARSQLTDAEFKVTRMDNLQVVLTDNHGMALATVITRDAGSCPGSGVDLREAAVETLRCVAAESVDRMANAVERHLQP